MSSLGGSFSCNDKTSESNEESTWTMYLEDFILNYKPEDCTIASEDTESCTWLVSDAVSPADRKFAGVDNMVGFCRPNHSSKGLSFKKRKKVTNLADHDLEDTASSPVNTPKIPDKYYDIEMIGKHEEKAHASPKEDGSTSGQTDNTNEVGLINGRESDYTELKNKGLCLVPLSMVTNFFG